MVLADYTVREDAPKGRIRVAVLHVMETGAPRYAARAVAAAAPGGGKIEVEVEVVPQGEKR